MIYPTFSELTKDQFNRYQLAVATAKCARIITDELFTKDKRLGETIGARLNLIAKIHAELRSITQQCLKPRRIIRSTDDQDIFDPGKH